MRYPSDNREAILKELKPIATVTHSCPSCGTGTKCEIEQGKPTCWCFGVQVKSSLCTGDVCLCRTCLTEQ